MGGSGPLPTLQGMSPVPRPTAAFFDLDKTIIAKSSTLAFSREFQAGGLISRGAVLRSAYAQFVYLVGGADHDQMEKMRQFMSQLCSGWDVETVKEIVGDTLHNIVDPLVYDEAVSLIEEHHLAGRDVIIVSTSGSEVVEPIGEMLGADKVVATRMEVRDGKYTGEIGFYAYAENKATAIRDLAARRGYDLKRCYAYSDSVTDVLHARGRRTPPRRQPRQGPSAHRARPRLAHSRLRQAGRVAHQTEVATGPSDHRRTHRRGCRGDPRSGLAQPQAASRRGLKSQGLCSSGPRRTQDTRQLHRLTRWRYPRGDLPFLQGVGQTRICRGPQLDNARLVAKPVCRAASRSSKETCRSSVPLIYVRQHNQARSGLDSAPFACASAA